MYKKRLTPQFHEGSNVGTWDYIKFSKLYELTHIAEIYAQPPWRSIPLSKKTLHGVNSQEGSLDGGWDLDSCWLQTKILAIKEDSTDKRKKQIVKR